MDKDYKSPQGLGVRYGTTSEPETFMHMAKKHFDPPVTGPRKHARNHSITPCGRTGCVESLGKWVLAGRGGLPFSVLAAVMEEGSYEVMGMGHREDQGETKRNMMMARGPRCTYCNVENWYCREKRC
jgi:hypothetical protein